MGGPPATRVHTGFLHAYELKLLDFFAAVMPGWVTPDLLTVTGVMSGALIGLAYYYSTWDINWVHMANFGLVLHWFADSLDGHLARYRNRSRPNYGLFVDELADCIAVAFMCIGLGMSPVMPWTTALFIIIGFYFAVIVHGFLMFFEKQHVVSAGGLSGTEGRLILMLANLIIIAQPVYTTIVVIHVATWILITFVMLHSLWVALQLALRLKEKDENELKNRHNLEV
mmetsp:Transcript_12257/g.16951  ORF Transcript_12257/g.16951 Transcript_12257/m.16951 type:complete len:227 (-) Transcript_12257:65-745(-)